MVNFHQTLLNLRYFGLSLCFLSAVYSAQALTLYFKDGATMECESASFEGEYVRVKIKSGELKIPLMNLSEKTFNEITSSTQIKSTASNEKETLPLPKAQESQPPEKSVLVSEVIASLTDSSKQDQSNSNSSVAKTATFSVPATWKKVLLTDLKSELPESDSNIQIFDKELTLSGKPKVGMDGDQVIVYYRIAMQADGKTPGPHADQLLFYAPYINDFTGAKGRETQAYTDLMGFTVFSFRIKTDRTDTFDYTQAYWAPGGGWFDLVFEAADKIRRKHDLKETKMFLWGNSSGSGMGQRLVSQFPDKFSAVALMGGSGYDSITKATGKPWLIMNTLAASEESSNTNLFSELEKVGDSAIYAQTPPWREMRGGGNFYHSAGSLAISLAQSYFWGIYQELQKNSAQLSSKSWSLVARGESPFDLYQVPPDTLLPVFPDGRGWFRLPGESMAFFWAQRPQPMTTEKIILASGRSIPLMIAQPRLAGPAPRGLVITTTEFSYLQYESMINDLNHWAEEGYVAVALRSSQSILTKNDQPIPWKLMMDWIKARPNLAALPIYLSYAEGQSLPLDAWKESDLRKHLKAFLISGIDADESFSKNKEKLERMDLGVPTLVSVYIGKESKYIKDPIKDDKIEAYPEIEKRVSQSFKTIQNPPTIHVAPPLKDSLDARQTFAIKRAAEFFQDYR